MTDSSIGIDSFSCARKLHRVRELCLVLDVADVDLADADAAVGKPEAHVLARQVVTVEEVLERDAERDGSRTSPPAMIPVGSGSRWSLSRRLLPLLLTTAAAICDVPSSRPTIVFGPSLTLRPRAFLAFADFGRQPCPPGGASGRTA